MPTPASQLSLLQPSLFLDLGSGPCPAPGFTGVDYGCDPAPGSSVLHANLWDGTPWPFDDESVERLRASHVIEHIPHDRICIGTGVAKVTRRALGQPPTVRTQEYPITQDAFFWFFDEAFRIAKPGCTFELSWPHPNHDHADQDPTHCRRIPAVALTYLSREGRRTLRVHHYPVGCDWRIVPGSVQILGMDEEIKSFETIGEAARHHGVFHEIRATLMKPGPSEPSEAMGWGPESDFDEWAESEVARLKERSPA